jgi:hypothetical protein
LALGGVVVVATFTVAGALDRYPLFTMSWATKFPVTSATKVGLAVLAPDNVAWLPDGKAINDHE